jgi:hypothetical protein
MFIIAKASAQTRTVWVTFKLKRKVQTGEILFHFFVSCHSFHMHFPGYKTRYIVSTMELSVRA